jgi:hypothetical protein
VAQHLATSTGTFLAARMLTEEGNNLVGMRRVALTSIGLSCLVPVLMWLVEQGVLRRDRRLAAQSPPAPAAAVQG